MSDGPDDIPQDIWDTAVKYAGGEFAYPEVAEGVARAILAERERCARAATNELKNTSLLMSNPPKSSAAWEIRNRINSGEPQ